MQEDRSVIGTAMASKNTSSHRVSCSKLLAAQHAAVSCSFAPAFLPLTWATQAAQIGLETERIEAITAVGSTFLTSADYMLHHTKSLCAESFNVAFQFARFRV